MVSQAIWAAWAGYAAGLYCAGIVTGLGLAYMAYAWMRAE